MAESFLGRIFRAFRYRDFRIMWLGACVSTIGTFVQQFAQSWLVYDLTKDPFYLGLDLFLGQLPIMLFSLFGGVFADRLDRKKMLLASQYIQMICAFMLAVLFATHTVRVWHILALVLRRWRWAILWRTGLFGAAANAGGTGGSCQRDFDELDPVQSRTHHRPDTRRPGVYLSRGDLVFRLERRLLYCGDHFAVRDQGAIRARPRHRCPS